MEGFSFTESNIRAGSLNLSKSQILPGLPRKGVGFLLGSPNIGKTFLLMSLAYEVALAKKHVGLITPTQKPLKVFYLAAEDFCDGIFSRAMQHFNSFTDEEKAILGVNLQLFNLDYPLISRYNDYRCDEALEELINVAKGFDLIIIDTIRKATGTAREVEEDTLYEQMLDTLARETNAAVLVSHHLRKKQGSAKDKEEIDSTGGSGLSSTQARSKFHIHLDTDPKDVNIRYISHTKDNYVPREYYLSPLKPQKLTFLDNGLMVNLDNKLQKTIRVDKPAPKISNAQKSILSVISKDDNSKLEVSINNVENKGNQMFNFADDNDL